MQSTNPKWCEMDCVHQGFKAPGHSPFRVAPIVQGDSLELRSAWFLGPRQNEPKNPLPQPNGPCSGSSLIFAHISGSVLLLSNTDSERCGSLDFDDPHQIVTVHQPLSFKLQWPPLALNHMISRKPKSFDQPGGLQKVCPPKFDPGLSIAWCHWPLPLGLNTRALGASAANSRHRSRAVTAGRDCTSGGKKRRKKNAVARSRTRKRVCTFTELTLCGSLQ